MANNEHVRGAERLATEGLVNMQGWDVTDEVHYLVEAWARLRAATTRLEVGMREAGLVRSTDKTWVIAEPTT